MNLNRDPVVTGGAVSHSTALMAADAAKQAGVRTLILTHFSTRYEGEGGSRLAELLAEAQSVFPNTLLARDLWSYDVHIDVPDR